MGTVFDRNGDGLRLSEHESWTVESQRAETGRNGLAGIGELSRKCHETYVDDPPAQQRHIPRTWCMHAQRRPVPYVFNHGKHQSAAAPVLENPVTGQSFGYVNQIDTGGTANYNGLLLSVQRRAARGITISGNYTWSHCISDLWQENAQSPNADQGWSDPNNRRFDRGNCSTQRTDRRHLFNFSSVAETPQFSNAALRLSLPDGVFLRSSKLFPAGYLSITTNQDRALTGMSGQRVEPDSRRSLTVTRRWATILILPHSHCRLWARSGTWVEQHSRPGTWQFDMALSRTFQIRERQRVEFRAEAFNVTNSLLVNDPVANLNSNTFGQVTSAKDPRIMQFALKYFF